MTIADNVVRMWRRRPELMQCRGWKCEGCGKLSHARRLTCPACGARSEFSAVLLPREGTVLAATISGAQFEHLDQATRTRKAVLLKLGENLKLACLAADADTPYVLRLQGKRMSLSIRRIPSQSQEEDSPIAYGLKAALTIESRKLLKAETTKS